MRKINKKGAEGWTVGRLLAVILAVVLLALIIYGWSNKGLIPLRDRIVGMWDNTMGMFGWGDDSAVESKGGVEVMIDGELEVGEITLTRNWCKINFEGDLGIYGIDFTEDFTYSKLGKYEEVYVVESDAWMESAQVLEKPTKKIYFYYFDKDGGWKWSPAGSSPSDWFSVENIGSVKTLKGGSTHATSYIREQVITKLIGKFFEDGVKIIEGSAASSGITGVSKGGAFVDADYVSPVEINKDIKKFLESKCGI